MADIYASLAGQGQEPYEEELAANPWYQGGVGMASAKIPFDYETSGQGERALIRALQGLGSGVMTGLGQAQTADIFRPQQKTLFEALGAEVPAEIDSPNWTPRTTQGLLLEALLDKQFEREKELQELKDENQIAKALASKGYSYNPETGEIKVDQGFVEGQKSIAKAKEEGRGGGNIFRDPSLVTATDRSALAGAAGMVTTLEDAARELENFSDDSTIEWQLKKRFAATDAGVMKLKLDMLVRQITKAIEGARPTDYDAETYRKIMQGDWTVNPKQVARLIRQARDAVAVDAEGKVRGYQTMKQGPEAYIQALRDRVTTKGAIPPGYKRQVNPKTGESRIVPQ